MQSHFQLVFCPYAASKFVRMKYSRVPHVKLCPSLWHISFDSMRPFTYCLWASLLSSMDLFSMQPSRMWKSYDAKPSSCLSFQFLRDFDEWTTKVSLIPSFAMLIGRKGSKFILRGGFKSPRLLRWDLSHWTSTMYVQKERISAKKSAQWVRDEWWTRRSEIDFGKKPNFDASFMIFV